MGGIEYQQLLTDDEKRAYLHEVFGHRFTHQGKLQLPELDQYNSLYTNEGLQHVGTAMCRWIGLRVSGLTFQFSDEAHTFEVDLKSKSIFIHSSFKKHPYSCGAILALAVITYALQKANHATSDVATVEFASVELGLGLWIVNALQPEIKRSHKIYHIVSTSWDQREFITLQNYSAQSYADSVIRFAHENRIPAEDYLPYVPRRCRHLLPELITSHSERYLPETNATLSHKKTVRVFWAKIVLFGLVIASSISLAIYITISHQSIDTTARDQQASTIESLRGKYNDCLKEASRQQSTYDPNDLFMTRQVDATKARCESLRNQYNYAIDQYKTMN